MKKTTLLLATALLTISPLFPEKAKVMLVQTQCEHTDRDRISDTENGEPKIPPDIETYAFVFKKNSSVEIYSDWNRPVDAFSYDESMWLKIGKNGTCEFRTDIDHEESLRHSISFEGKNTVLVADPFEQEFSEHFGESYQPDSFILSAESYEKLKSDLLKKCSVEAAVSFLSSALYFWNDGDSIHLIAENAEEYQIQSGVRRLTSFGGAYCELHLSYTYKNGMLASFQAEDKGDYSGVVFKKTLVSDTEKERKYREDINDFFEHDSHSVQTLDKQSNVWRSEGEAMGNRIWDFRHCHFPPKIVYMDSDELSAFLEGKLGGIEQ